MVVTRDLKFTRRGAESRVEPARRVSKEILCRCFQPWIEAEASAAAIRDGTLDCRQRALGRLPGSIRPAQTYDWAPVLGIVALSSTTGQIAPQLVLSNLGASCDVLPGTAK